MMIDWIHYTPLASAAGGALIGLSAALPILFNGRMAGNSGILGGLLAWPKGDRAWRLAFLSGMLAGMVLFELIKPVRAQHRLTAPER